MISETTTVASLLASQISSGKMTFPLASTVASLVAASSNAMAVDAAASSVYETANPDAETSSPGGLLPSLILLSPPLFHCFLGTYCCLTNS